jgi:hypothetical protein
VEVVATVAQIVLVVGLLIARPLGVVKTGTSTALRGTL